MLAVLRQDLTMYFVSHPCSLQVLLYLARAYYDSDNLLKGQAALARATHLAPTDYKLRFNFALTLQVRILTGTAIDLLSCLN